MKTLLTLITFLTATQFAKAHGEDNPGPNGGHIKMPANFHTELVANADGSYRIYLLDLSFQNPVTEKSSVAVSVKSGKKTTKLNCMAMQDHFHCTTKKPIKTGDLIIRANRSGTPASMDATYTLPLKKFETNADEKAKPKSDDHSAHH